MEKESFAVTGLLAGLGLRAVGRYAARYGAKKLLPLAFKRGSTAWKGGIKNDIGNIGRFFKNPISFGKHQWQRSGVVGKTATFGFPAWDLSHGRPGEAAGWFIAPTAMGTKSIVDAGKAFRASRQATNSGGKYFGQGY